MKILLIEGSPTESHLFDERESAGADVTASIVRADARDAAACALVENPDVVLVHGSDLDAVALLVAEMPHLPVIVLTGVEDDTFAKNAIGRGAQDCIARTEATGGQLLRVLGRAIARKRVDAEALAAATRSRDEVIAIIAHDLRNSLNVMTMTLALLGEDRGIPEEKRGRHLKKLDRATARMVALIDALVDISRMDAHRLVIEPVLLTAIPLVEEALAHCEPAATDKSVRIAATVPGEVTVFADPARLVQVLTILLSQAVAMAPLGGAVEVTVESAGPAARFTVKVAGAVIPAEQIPRVFDRFWSKKHGMKDVTGLALTIAKGLVDAHGGQIEVASDASGTAFSFLLHAKKTADR